MNEAFPSQPAANTSETFPSREQQEGMDQKEIIQEKLEGEVSDMYQANVQKKMEEKLGPYADMIQSF